jgi:hypothetical protein
MSNCNNNNEKRNSNNGLNLSSLSNIIKIINAAFSAGKKPALLLPPQLNLVGSNLKSGLSARDIAARIISRRSEAGLPDNLTFADGPNSDLIMEAIRIEETVLALKTEAVVQIEVPPGILIKATGIGNLGQAVPVKGATANVGTGRGSIS